MYSQRGWCRGYAVHRQAEEKAVGQARRSVGPGINGRGGGKGLREGLIVEEPFRRSSPYVNVQQRSQGREVLERIVPHFDTSRTTTTTTIARSVSKPRESLPPSVGPSRSSLNSRPLLTPTPSSAVRGSTELTARTARTPNSDDKKTLLPSLEPPAPDEETTCSNTVTAKLGPS